MHIPQARKLPSGSWTVQISDQGRRISITRPTEKEAVAAAMAMKAGIIQAAKTPPAGRTLSSAIEDYISARENVLSPSTIAGYRVIARNRFKSLHYTKLSDITAARWQRAVSDESRSISPKTLKNSAAFVETVIAEYTGTRLSARMPQVVPNDLPWLTPEQIPVFLRAIAGSRYEIPALLALSSLRQSEIIAMRWQDVDLARGRLVVHGSAVLDSSGKLVQKQANKNSSSRREVPFLIPQLRQAVEAAHGEPDAYVYPHYNNTLRININRICEANSLPHVGIHGLRRSFASLCYHLGISEAVTMMAGGWSNIETMRKIYTKISEKDLTTQATRFEQFFANANANANDK